MSFTASSTIGEVMKNKSNAAEILAKHAGQPIDPNQLNMALGMSIQQVAGFIGWNQAKIDAFLKDLNA